MLCYPILWMPRYAMLSYTVMCWIHRYIHTYKHRYIYVYIHTYIHTYTHTPYIPRNIDANNLFDLSCVTSGSRVPQKDDVFRISGRSTIPSTAAAITQTVEHCASKAVQHFYLRSGRGYNAGSLALRPEGCSALLSGSSFNASLVLLRTARHAARPYSTACSTRFDSYPGAFAAAAPDGLLLSAQRVL